MTISATASGFTGGSDTLQVLDNDGGGGGGDDHGNNAAAATSVAMPSTTAGTIEVGTDVDWFRFNAVANTQYTFQTALGTLTDTRLELFSTDGTTSLAENDDISSGVRASRIIWTSG